jgi:hypothetical protein
MSHFPVEVVESHGVRFLSCLIQDEAFAGGWALEKLLKQFYRDLWRARGERAQPWPSVLREFNAVLKSINEGKEPKTYRTYKWFKDGRRRRRLRVYWIPSPEELGIRQPDDATIAA